MIARWLLPFDRLRLPGFASRTRPDQRGPSRQQAEPAARSRDGEEVRVARALATVLPLCLWRP